LTASRGAGFKLAYSVSISGNTIAVVGPEKSKANGAVYLYVKPAPAWRSATETARLTLPTKSDLLGYSVCIGGDGNEITGGAPGWQDGGGRGAIDLFVKPVSGWKTTSKVKARLTARDGKNPDALGFSVSAAANAVVSGAPYATIGSNPKEGAAYLFGR